MALTLDGTTPMPIMGGTGGTGLAAGAGVIGGLVLGSVLGNNGNGLFGGNGNNNGGGIAYDSLQTQIQTLQGQIGAQGMHSEINEIEAAISAANIANLQGISQNALLYQNGNTDLATALANGNFTTLTSINGLGRDLTAASTQALINNLQNFNSLGSQIATGTNQLISGQNAQNATMAACCCEMKQTIAAEGAATRALINDLNVQNLRDQLSTANNKVSNNEQNQYLLSTLLAHLSPVVTTASVVQ